MARIVVRSCAVLIALALAGSAVRAQRRQSSAPSDQSSRTAEQLNTRIISLLEQLAEQARTFDNLAFAVRAQSQAASLLWSQDAERARSIYRSAFESLTSAVSKSRSEADSANASKTAESIHLVNESESLQLRSELLNQIAAHDPELAQDLARGLTDQTERSRNGCADNSSIDCHADPIGSPSSPGAAATPTREVAERCELLMSAALQIVERDPQQAMAFAQMSVALGTSSNLARLLILMRTVDAERADLLFSNAVARLEQYPQVDLIDVRTLGSYIVSVVNSSTSQPLSKTLVVRFLNFAFDRISQGSGSGLAAKSPARDESAAVYFIGRQLTDLFARYLPDRLNQLQSYVSDQSDAGSYDLSIDPGEAKTRAPEDVARDAIETTDASERDSLYARAALGWLAQGEPREAQAAALKISDAGTRDRVLLSIARRYSSEKHIEEAIDMARRIADETSRIDLLVMLGGVALASKDSVRAVELLNEAETSSVKASPTLDRARSLVKIAGSFSTFDTTRSFEVLQSAIKAINEIIKQQEDSNAGISAPGARGKAAQAMALDELYAASLESTLAALAKADFDGALALAQQVPGEEASVIAQLAVCGGGLVAKAVTVQSASDGEVDSGVNP